MLSNDSAQMGAGGACPKHGVYQGYVCPDCTGARGGVADVESDFDPRPLELMDGALAGAARVSADVRIAGRGQDFELPIWRDIHGDIRIALPKIAPQHGGDHDQVIFDLGDLLTAIGEAVNR